MRALPKRRRGKVEVVFVAREVPDVDTCVMGGASLVRKPTASAPPRRAGRPPASSNLCVALRFELPREVLATLTGHAPPTCNNSHTLPEPRCLYHASHLHLQYRHVCQYTSPTLLAAFRISQQSDLIPAVPSRRISRFASSTSHFTIVCGSAPVLFGIRRVCSLA